MDHSGSCSPSDLYLILSAIQGLRSVVTSWKAISQITHLLGILCLGGSPSTCKALFVLTVRNIAGPAKLSKSSSYFFSACLQGSARSRVKDPSRLRNYSHPAACFTKVQVPQVVFFFLFLASCFSHVAYEEGVKMRTEKKV